MHNFLELTNRGALQFKVQADRRQMGQLPAGSVDRRARWADTGLHRSEQNRFQDGTADSSSGTTQDDR
jgi:hypothetical protein